MIVTIEHSTQIAESATQDVLKSSSMSSDCVTLRPTSWSVFVNGEYAGTVEKTAAGYMGMTGRIFSDWQLAAQSFAA